MRLIQAHLKFQLPFEVKRDNGWYVASCHKLDVHSQGKTRQKAKKNLIEALSLFLFSCLERGKLDAVLKERGFRPVLVKTIKKPSRSRFVDIDIPLNTEDTKVECPA